MMWVLPLTSVRWVRSLHVDASAMTLSGIEFEEIAVAASPRSQMASPIRGARLLASGPGQARQILPPQ
jgi:hypothetical protein